MKTPENLRVFAVEPLPGQFDQRADSAAECVQLISQGERPRVRYAKIYALTGDISDEVLEAVKHYVINPVEAREASLALRDTLASDIADPAPVEVLDGFLELDEKGLKNLIDSLGLAMDFADIAFCQEHFRKEGRNPTITEIRVIDTYWSDHCRHTTFGTVLDDITIDDAVVQQAFDRYMAMRHELGRDERPVTLMDMGTIGAKYLKHTGKLTGLDESEEINACTVKVTVDVDGEDQDWLFLFKTRRTTTQQKSNLLVEQQPALVAPSATRFQAAVMCIKPCALPVQPIQPFRFLKHFPVSFPSESLLPLPPLVTQATATKLVLPPDRSLSSITLAM